MKTDESAAGREEGHREEDTLPHTLPPADSKGALEDREDVDGEDTTRGSQQKGGGKPIDRGRRAGGAREGRGGGKESGPRR